jgi:lysozyme
MIKVKAGPAIVKGIDISHHNGQVFFNRVKAAGFDFVYAKCSEYHADSTYLRNKAAAKAAGLLFGAYHFFHPSYSPADQADLFLKFAQLEPGDLLPALDWESTDGVPSMVDRARGLQWLDLVSKAIGGRKPLIYGSPYFLEALHLDAITFGKYPLWIAQYGVTAPLVPSPWERWACWQNSERGQIPGLVGTGGDVELFNGDLQALRSFCI